MIVGGDGGVGKTTFLYKYIKNKFLTDTKLTVGVSFLTKNIQVGEHVFSMAIWDFGGQDQFRFILKSYVRGAHAGLAIFALDRIQSFMHLKEWIPLLRSEKPELPLILVGTKADLEDEDMKIPEDEIQELVKEYNMLGYVRISSKTGENVEEPVKMLAKYFSKKMQ